MIMVYYCAAGKRAEYCDERVCLSVCLSVCVHVTYGRGSILLWRRSDTLYTSVFTDDAIFAHKPRLPKRSAQAALGLAINCAQ